MVLFLGKNVLDILSLANKGFIWRCLNKLVFLTAKDKQKLVSVEWKVYKICLRHCLPNNKSTSIINQRGTKQRKTRVERFNDIFFYGVRMEASLYCQGNSSPFYHS